MLVSSPECAFSDAILLFSRVLISFASHHVLFRDTWRQSLTLFCFLCFVLSPYPNAKSAQQPIPASYSSNFRYSSLQIAKSHFLEADETFIRNSCLDYHFLMWNWQNTSSSTLSPSQRCKWTKFTSWLWMLISLWEYEVWVLSPCAVKMSPGSTCDNVIWPRGFSQKQKYSLMQKVVCSKLFA